MELKLKLIFISVALFLSTQSLAYTSEYIPAFKPVKKSKNISEFQDNIQKEVFQLRSMINLPEKQIIGLVKNSKDAESKRTPADI